MTFFCANPTDCSVAPVFGNVVVFSENGCPCDRANAIHAQRDLCKTVEQITLNASKSGVCYQHDKRFH